MAQQSRSPHEFFPHELYGDSDHEILLFPTRFAACDPPGVVYDLPAVLGGFAERGHR
jgi:hypothetical protein